MNPASAIFWRFSGESISDFRAWARVSEFSGSTISPVSPHATISGIPPAFVATTGRGTSIASRFTRPNASRREGRQKIFELFKSFGISLRRPRRVTWRLIPSFWMSDSRFSRSFPSPIITSFTFGNSFTISGMASIRYLRPFRS